MNGDYVNSVYVINNKSKIISEYIDINKTNKMQKFITINEYSIFNISNGLLINDFHDLKNILLDKTIYFSCSDLPTPSKGVLIKYSHDIKMYLLFSDENPNHDDMFVYILNGDNKIIHGKGGWVCLDNHNIRRILSKIQPE